MIIDVKPPPPYSTVTGSSTNAPPPFRTSREVQILSALPAHILLQIVHSTIPDDADSPEYRQALYWLATTLRLVSRTMYTACMHVLRSAYLPIYQVNVKPPYTSDPFPYSVPSPLPTNASPLASVQRETAVLDLFIALKVKEDVRNDESDLHLGSDRFKDIFELMQPRSRMEDLIRYYGMRKGVVTYNPNPSSTSREIYFGNISANWSPRKVGLVVSSRGKKKTWIEVKRERDETLENVAKRIVKELQALLR